MTPLHRWLTTTFLGRFFNKLADGVLYGLFWLCRLAGLIRWYHDREACSITRAAVLWEEAAARGIEMEGAMFWKRPIDFYRVKLQGKWKYFNGLPRPDGIDTTAQLWMDDKAVLKDRLRDAGLPIPPGVSYSDFESLAQAFQGLEKPVIVKPRLGSRGRHTTTYIYNEEQLQKAFKIAKELCHWVVMEEHLVGSVYRGTMIDGKLRGVLGGDPPRIAGDGVQTIRALIDFKNGAKQEGVRDIIITPITLEFLARNAYTLETILPLGATIDVTEKIGVSYGGTSYEITDETHPDIKIILESAAAVIGDPLMGFDFIIPNITQSPASQKWGIIECNGIPFINLHHFPLLGKPNNVAKYVWDMVI